MEEEAVRIWVRGAAARGVAARGDGGGGHGVAHSARSEAEEPYEMGGRVSA